MINDRLQRQNRSARAIEWMERAERDGHHQLISNHGHAAHDRGGVGVQDKVRRAQCGDAD